MPTTKPQLEGRPNMATEPAPHFRPVTGSGQVGPLRYAGRAVPSRLSENVSGDGMWIEQNRADGGVLFLLIDIESKGPMTLPLREMLGMALRHPSTWELTPSDLLTELHSQAAVVWAETKRSFVAQAVLVLPHEGHFLFASAGIPHPYFARVGEGWKTLEPPATESIAWLGRPDIHAEGSPIFPNGKVELPRGARLMLITDGLTDAGREIVNEKGQRQMLGSEGVLSCLNEMTDRPTLDDLLCRVFARAEQQDGAYWPSDDCTALVWEL